MKLGSFVGQGSVSMVNDEMQFCRETINNAIKSNDFGFLEFEVLEVENSKTYDEESMFELKLTFQKETTLRDSDDNAYIPKYIRVSVRKRKGYDQNEVGSWTTWEKGFKPDFNKRSFECSINLIGHYRPYRGRNIETYVGIGPTHYTYGTELKDLGLDNCFDAIASYMRHSYYSKTQLILPIPHSLNYH